MGTNDLPRCPLADKFLHGATATANALVLVNTYECAKFQLSSSISFRDTEIFQKRLIQTFDAAQTPVREIELLRY